LHGKSIIVAAASRGLAKVKAHAFALEGANVVMFARDPASIEAAAADARTATTLSAFTRWSEGGEARQVMTFTGVQVLGEDYIHGGRNADTVHAKI
jgi:NAD(P)-dependent dehydrogenase (short-subunit alcohol dehydrogenase family)